MKAGILYDYTIEKGLLKITTTSGQEDFSMAFYFLKDIVDDIAIKALPNIGTLHQGDILFIFAGETALVRKVIEK